MSNKPKAAVTDDIKKINRLLKNADKLPVYYFISFIIKFALATYFLDIGILWFMAGVSGGACMLSLEMKRLANFIKQNHQQQADSDE